MVILSLSSCTLWYEASSVSHLKKLALRIFSLCGLVTLSDVTILFMSAFSKSLMVGSINVTIQQ